MKDTREQQENIDDTSEENEVWARWNMGRGSQGNMRDTFEGI